MLFIIAKSTYHRVCALLRHAVILACMPAAVILGAAVNAPDSADATTLVIDGAGDGHGVGMSQDGALGYAEHGWSYSAILAHYYTGTALAQAPAGTIVKVLVGSKVRNVPLEEYVRGV